MTVIPMVTRRLLRTKQAAAYLSVSEDRRLLEESAEQRANTKVARKSPHLSGDRCGPRWNSKLQLR
jgi:hypothetical protein